MQKQQSLQQQAQPQHQQKQLLYRISFTDDPQSTLRKYKYNPQSILPFLYFYKLLALKSCSKPHRNKLILNIPDTIIFNDKDNPVMWMFTNNKGEVQRIDNVQYFVITEKFTENAFDKELVAILKKPSYGYGGLSGNDVKVVSASQVKTVISSVLSSRNQASVIQRFVKTSSIKPSIVRTCWRSNNSHQGWILSSNYEYTSSAKVNQISKLIVNTKHLSTFNATKCTSTKHLQQTLKYVINIVKFVQGHLGIKFLEMVCDFIKDQGGNWWYVNTKAFILDKPDQKVDLKPIITHDCDVQVQEQHKKKLQTYTKCKKCKYCYKVVAQHLMTHKLTLMMILQCDQNLIKMGKQYPWLQRCYSHHVGSVNLYVEHKVCDSCYRFYKQVQKLTSLQTQLARLSGIKLSQDNKNVVSITSIPYFKGYSAQFGSKLQKLQYDIQMPQSWVLPQNQQIKIQLNTSKSTYKRCRFMIYIHGIRDIPKDIFQKHNTYTLGFQFLGQNIKYKLDIRENSARIRPNTENQQTLFNVQIDQMKIIYFFIENRTQITQFLKNQETLKITLYQNQVVFGKLQMELNDFKSDKVIKRDYFKMFSGKNVFPYLSWGLFATLGLHQGSTIETSSLKLAKKDGLLFPQTQYHGPDPLPEDWIQMLQQKNDEQNISQNYSQIKPKSFISEFQQLSVENSNIEHDLRASLNQQILCYSRNTNKKGTSRIKQKTNFNGSSSTFNQKVKRKPYY